MNPAYIIMPVVEQEIKLNKEAKKTLEKYIKKGADFAKRAYNMQIPQKLKMTSNFEVYYFGLCLASWEAKDLKYQAQREYNDPLIDAPSRIPFLNYLGRKSKESAFFKLQEQENNVEIFDKLKQLTLEIGFDNPVFMARHHTIALAANDAIHFFFDIVDHNDNSVYPNALKNIDPWCEKWSARLSEADARNLEA